MIETILFLQKINIEQYQLIYRYTNTKDKYDHLVQIFKYLKLEEKNKQKLLKEISLIINDFLQIIINEMICHGRRSHKYLLILQN